MTFPNKFRNLPRTNVVWTRCTTAGNCQRDARGRTRQATQWEKGMSNGMRNGMSELPEELSGAELDAVTGGQAIGSPVAAGGLVNVAVGPTNVDVLRGADIDIIDDVTLRDIANNNNVGVGALVQVLGGTAGVITGEAQQMRNRT